MKDTDRQRWRELVREDKTATSTAFVYDLDWLQLTHYILNQNFRELVQIPDVLERNIDLIAIDKRRESEALHVEFMRRLHNYLAAVKTLVDHTRKFRKNWGDLELDTEFQRKLDALLEKSVVKFVQELRNPTQHSRLPVIARVTTFERVEPNSDAVRPLTRLMVDINELLVLHDWSPQAREYIREAADRQKVDVTLAVRRYQEAITEFYEWFFAAVTEVKKELLEDFRRRREELARFSQLSSGN